MNKLIRIAWNDAVADSTWTCRDEVMDHQVEHCISVGWLIHETTEAYIITCTKTDNHLMMGYQVIPRGTVTDIYELSEKKSDEITLE
jgi:hypothetical protein